ncbi:MAG: glycosyltransferase [Ilumatobacteraceae bacterium]
MKIAAYGCGQNYTSARFRVRQFIGDLATYDIHVREYIAPIYKHLEPRSHNPAWLAAIKVARPIALLPSVLASHRYDASWIQKEMIWGRDTLERFTQGPRFFDVDDALWVPREGSAYHMARLARHMDVIIAGNEAIANWFSQFANDVRIVPTAIDCSLFCPPPVPAPADRPFTIEWTGQKVTLYHLAVVEQALQIFMERHPDVQFHAVSDAGPVLTSLPADRVTWVPWSPAVEVTAIQNAHIGIMPLVDDENGRAKCAFKMLQYMGCAVPSVVTPIGFNKDILKTGGVGLPATTTDEWVDAFESLYADRDEAADLGRRGRQVALDHFDRPIMAKQLAELFIDVVGVP